VTVRARLAIWLVVLALATSAHAQDAPAPPTTSAASAPPTTLAGEVEQAEDTSLGSPQSSMRGFLRASSDGEWEKAAEYLDLSRVRKTGRATVGPLFARQLRTVIDRTIWIDVEALSDAPEGNRDDGLPQRRELIGPIRSSSGQVDLVLERVPEGGKQVWKIASSVVARVPDLYAEFGDGPFVNVLPDFMIEVRVLEARLWQWLVLALLLALGSALGWLMTGPLLRLLSVLVPEDRRHQSARLLAAVAGPLRLLVVIAVVVAAMPLLALSVPAAQALTLVRKTAATAAITWLGIRIVDVIAAIADDRLRIHGRAGAVSVIPLGRRTFKIFVAIMAGIVIVQNLGYDATGLLAGLGVGGLALALAAQKTVENLFGGVMLITDQPVRVGDLCRFGTRTGTVEDIGLRSTRLRTPERSLVSIPNAEFASGQIENLSVRDRMQLLVTIGVRLDATPAQLEAALEAIRGLLDAVPRIDRGANSVRLVNVGPSAFEVQISGYVQTRDWNEFLAARETFFLQVLKALDAAGTGLAGRTAAPPAAPA
jgi:MscS family membrane protein